MQDRLVLMKDVAAWKHARAAPVVDEERERQVLESTVEQASSIGIDAATARHLFALQIRLAARVQESWLASWRSGWPAPQAVRDLAGELRPELDRLGSELLHAIYLALPELQQPDFVARYSATARVFD